MPTPTQKKTAQSIINIFETGSALGDYSLVTSIEGDIGHLTYGRSQTALGSGNLHLLLKEYVDNPGPGLGMHWPHSSNVSLHVIIVLTTSSICTISFALRKMMQSCEKLRMYSSTKNTGNGRLIVPHNLESIRHEDYCCYDSMDLDHGYPCEIEQTHSL